MFYKFKLKPNEVMSNISLVSFTNLTVKDTNDLIVAHIQGQGEVILEKGDMYAFDKDLTKMTLTNIHDREVTIEFWASNSAKYTDSKSTINGSINVRSQSADSSRNTQFNITSPTRILDKNTGRKTALIMNNSEDSIAYIKSYDAINILGFGMPLLPQSSIVVNSVEPYFVDVVNDVMADIRVLEESY